MSEISNQLSGECLCGSIKFVCESPGKPISICHCEQCRRWGGSPWGATSVPLKSLKFTQGESNLCWFESSNFARRGFCKQCGSSMFWHADRYEKWSKDIAISAGCLNEPTNLQVATHIWCGSKGDYYEINDGIPQQLNEDWD